ncbi:uncharacterized protein BJ171DRAFT_524654 [Polychytrium aggregatum]|uniref:uncharacterized protein n=1 Tax=Polychytrium aggregatum TaxID=110093 RepID=UPI0022FE74C7|nr:uncharacterized protein BJ171DRAFT_524654 [Polychytrium aggregatum]KAI9193631.1 hypothetical protein BJ171DRAFT_524654 [Polychytrium aggregatum]
MKEKQTILLITVAVITSLTMINFQLLHLILNNYMDIDSASVISVSLGMLPDDDLDSSCLDDRGIVGLGAVLIFVVNFVFVFAAGVLAMLATRDNR